MARKSSKPDREGKKVDSSKAEPEREGETAKPAEKATREFPVAQAMDGQLLEQDSPKNETDGQVPLVEHQTDDAEIEADGQIPLSHTPADPPVVTQVAIPVCRVPSEPLSELFKRGYVSPPNPDPDWGKDRGAQRDDTDGPVALPWQYKAPILRVSDPDQISMALAAFRLGRLGIALNAEAETLWDDLTRRIAGNLSHDAAFTLIPTAAKQLLVARRLLVGLIAPHVYLHLETMVRSFIEFNQRMIEQYYRGEFDRFAFDGGPPKWEFLSLELASACSHAMRQDLELRLLFDLGAAFGEFSVMTNNYYSSLLNDIREDESELTPLVIDEQSGADLEEQRGRSDSPARANARAPDPFPEIGKITRLASSLPEAILGRSRLLKSLAAIAGNYGRLGEEKAFKQYFKANRDCWMDDSRTHGSRTTAKTVLPVEGPDGNPFRMPPVKRRESLKDAIRRIDVEQVRLIEADLSTIPDDFWSIQAGPGDKESRWTTTKPRWDAQSETLSFRGKTKKLRGDATTAAPILNCFEECKWQSRVDSPFPGGGRVTSEQRLVNGVRTLIAFANDLGITFERIGLNAVEWRETHQR